MKVSEFRKLIREEVRKIVNEASVTDKFKNYKGETYYTVDLPGAPNSTIKANKDCTGAAEALLGYWLKNKPLSGKFTLAAGTDIKSDSFKIVGNTPDRDFSVTVEKRDKGAKYIFISRS